MTKTDVETIVDDYLRELDAALRAVAPPKRHELIQEVSEHIAEGRAELPDQNPSSVLGLLERLGRPQEIAAAAIAESEELNPPRSAAQSGSREGLTIALLLLGGFVLLVGWLIGVILLWTSDVWRIRDKVLGTLLFPGGLALPVWLILGPWRTAFGVSCVENIPPGGAPTSPCASTISPSWDRIALLVVAMIIPILVAIHLHRASRSGQVRVRT